MSDPNRHRSEPVLMLPPVITASLVALILIHVVRVFLLRPDQDQEVLLLFAFIPVRYGGMDLGGFTFPGGVAADIWTFVTYAGLHSDFSHLGMNALALAAFGGPVARRFGAVRFLLFCAVCAAAGAGLHLLIHWGQFLPVIGASGAISGLLAASARFVFVPGAPLGGFRLGGDDRAAYHRPAESLAELFSNPRSLSFVAVWFAINMLIGILPAVIGGGLAIAWQAHIGGFAAGLLLFPLFDPVPRRAVR